MASRSRQREKLSVVRVPRPHRSLLIVDGPLGDSFGRVAHGQAAQILRDLAGRDHVGILAVQVRWKQVLGDGLRSRKDARRATEVAVAVHALNRMLELGRPSYARTA